MQNNTSNTSFEWAIIGAGPAGIAAVGKLLDNHIDPKKILWIDPAFQVGDFGTHWKNVSSNTKVKLFSKFYAECSSFEYNGFSNDFAINGLNPEQTCQLSLAAEPLQWITNHLREKVITMQDKVIYLKLRKRQWEIALANAIDSAGKSEQATRVITAKNVILATGAEAKSLLFPQIEEITLKTALDPEKLKTLVNGQDTIAVFGSSHSAIIIIKALLEECNVKKVINFYQEPLRYAVILDDWTLFNDTGLKGNTAVWARENIDGIWPAKLDRVISHQDSLSEVLPLCQKAIYAIGFQKRLVSVEGLQSLAYNDRSGIIAPGLFGFGIGFPESKEDPFGTVEYRVGMWKFMEYITRVLPVWLQYGT